MDIMQNKCVGLWKCLFSLFLFLPQFARFAIEIFPPIVPLVAAAIALWQLFPQLLESGLKIIGEI
jgi:hypothetical protein